MKKMMIVALALAAAGAAFADEPTPDNTRDVPSVKTRAEVIAELQQARQNGQIAEGSEYAQYFQPFANVKSTKTRAQVEDEVKAARASGELNQLVRQDSGSAYLSRTLTAPANASNATAE